MSRFLRRCAAPLFVALTLGATAGPSVAQSADLPISANQRSTAQRVAQAGVPLSELAPDAPESYTIKAGDTLWGLSRLYLRSPWRWPELWGMNLDQLKNPHLIYPGQLLVLVRGEAGARLALARRVGGSGSSSSEAMLNDERFAPRVRDQALPDAALASVPMHLIGPFLNDAVVFDTDVLANAPRIAATQEGRVLLSRGEKAYVRGDVSKAIEWQIFREAKPMLDPDTAEVLGFEGRHVGTATRVSQGRVISPEEIMPSTFTISSLREEAGIGDRLIPLHNREHEAFAPHAPSRPISGRLVSVYGDGLNAGQNQVVALNRGAAHGIERGHVLALWRAGSTRVDRDDPDRKTLVLPDEKHGTLFVFRVFQKMSYALILQVEAPVFAGDKFTQP